MPQPSPVTFTPEEVAYMLLLVATSNPSRYRDDKALAVIYKCRSLTESDDYGARRFLPGHPDVRFETNV